MAGNIRFNVEQSSLDEHVRRICKRNLKIPAKVCKECPFLGPIIDTMERQGWEYNRQAMKKSIEAYRAKYNP